jgi:hypothetical protein
MLSKTKCFDFRHQTIQRLPWKAGEFSQKAGWKSCGACADGRHGVKLGRNGLLATPVHGFACLVGSK